MPASNQNGLSAVQSHICALALRSRRAGDGRGPFFARGSAAIVSVALCWGRRRCAAAAWRCALRAEAAFVFEGYRVFWAFRVKHLKHNHFRPGAKNRKRFGHLFSLT